MTRELKALLPTSSRLTRGRTGVDVMDRNRRANGGPVATTGNGTYGQFYQRDASGGFTAGGGDLRLGSSGVPGRRVPLASSHSASAPSQNTQPFAATNSRVGQPTGTLTKQQGKPAGGATRAASIVRTSRDGSNVPPAWSAGSANQGAGGANTIASDPLLRRTIHQISRQTLNERTHEQTTHAARDKNSLPNVTGGRPFAATAAVPRRKSPEEVAAMRPAWDGSPKDTAAHPGGGGPGGGARLAANQNSFADSAQMRRDALLQRTQLANKTGDRAAAFDPGATLPPNGVKHGYGLTVTGRLTPSPSESPSSSGRASPLQPYPSPRGHGPYGSRTAVSSNGRVINGGGTITGTHQRLSAGDDFVSSPTKSSFGGDGSSNSFIVGANKYARAGNNTTVDRDNNGGPTRLNPGATSMAGGSSGMTKENQDAHFLLETSAATEVKRGNFIAGVLDGHGTHGAKVSSFVRAKVAGEMESRHTRARFSKENGHLVRDDDAGLIARVSAATIRENLKESFANAQRDLLRSHGRDCQESGTTCVVCAREGDHIITANVGDSRCVLGREVGAQDARFAQMDFGSKSKKNQGKTFTAVDLSDDHKPDRPDEASRVARAGGIVEPARGLHGYAGPARVWRRHPRAGGLAVSRAFGDAQLTVAGVIADPEVRTERVTDRDAFIVLGSDGVWDHVCSAEAVRIVGEKVNELGMENQSVWRRAADAIVAKAAEGWRRSLGGGYRDDITCVVVPILH